MRIRLQTIKILESKKDLERLPEGKLLINTINAHSYNTALKDIAFAEALAKGDVLLPDGASIIHSCRWLKAKSQPTERVTGWNLFVYEMNKLEAAAKREGRYSKTVMFMGSSENVLTLIKKRVAVDYPNILTVTYSPPYKDVFSAEDNDSIIAAINAAEPNLLWIGMTAPKQEKWTYAHWNQLSIHCHVGTIGAVFDFFAQTKKRAPLVWQQKSLEWLYRLIQEPWRLWRRYLVGNILFIKNIIYEKISYKDV